MNQLIVALSLLTLAFGGYVTVNTNCPEQFVPNGNNICIRPSYIQGCMIYRNTYECDTCNQEYENVNGRCHLIQLGAKITPNIGCLIHNGQVCTNCANGFRRVNGVCLEGARFCLEYNSEAKCVKCQNEYSLIFGQCRHNTLLGCKDQKSDHTCVECYRPFELDNFHCGIPNCKSYNDYGCYTCECGYYITSNRRCQKMQDGCLKYSRETCTECLPHYKLKGGACEIEGCLEFSNGLCVVCKSDYDSVDGMCKLKNCFDWKDDTCYICDKDYTLHKGRCVKSTGKFVCEG